MVSAGDSRSVLSIGEEVVTHERFKNACSECIVFSRYLTLRIVLVETKGLKKFSASTDCEVFNVKNVFSKKILSRTWKKLCCLN